LKPGYRPSDPTFDVPAFTAIIMIEPHGKGTKYTALAMHKDEKDRTAHDRMGFSDGWGKALDQLLAAAKTMSGIRRVEPGITLSPAGLTRGSIILRKKLFAKRMDCRVKPAGDAWGSMTAHHALGKFF